MKKKIIAAALAAVVAFNICTVRPRAAAAAGIAIAVGSAAVFLMGVFTGQYDDTANGIGAVLENGVEGFEKAFIGTEKTFCGQVIESEDAWIVTGYKQICHKIESWVNSGEATIDEDGNLTIDYQQYLDLYSILAELVDLTVDIGTSIPYNVVSYPVGTPFAFSSMPVFCDLSSSSFNQSYFPVYYSSDKIYFSENYLNINLSSYMMGSSFAVGRGFIVRGINGISSASSGDTVFPDIHYITSGLDKCIGTYNSNSDFLYSKIADLSNSSAYYIFHVSSFTCFDGKSFQSVPASSLDTSNLSFSYLVCNGEGSEFVTSIRSYAAARDTSSLDDLSGTLPLDKTSNPDLIISSDGGIGKATDAITVSSVPGVADATLTDYMADVDVDIDIPSVISTKFPFCIPYDLIRILGVFCADPKAPVFRIPISTDPSQLDPFKGNQTVGSIPDDFEPMFDIDEELVIDLSVIPLVQPICYTVFIIGFVLLLIYITPKMINH